jgi:hypothetical protein
LLRCYPQSYRRARGEELVSTLLDAAPEGRLRPTWRERVTLVRHGLRCRLGRPESRSVVVWSVLTAVICGLFVAALGSWLGWEAARPEPGPAELQAIMNDAVPGGEVQVDSNYPGHFYVEDGDGPRPIRAADLRRLALDFGPFGGDGISYYKTENGASVRTQEPLDGDRALATARQRLAARGWRLYAPRTYPGGCDPDCGTFVMTMFRAQRGDTVLTLEVYTSDGTGDVRGSAYRATPRTAQVAAVVGGLFGAAVSWLVFGWASRRTEGMETVKGLFGSALLLWWAPALLAIAGCSAVVFGRPYGYWPPLWEWLFQPACFGIFLVGWAVTLIALVVAAVRPRLIGSTGRLEPGHPAGNGL